MQNEWIVANHAKVFKLLDKIERFKMKGAFTDDINLEEIQQVISQSYKEISNLQGQLTLLNEKYDQLKKDQEDMISKIQQQTPQTGKPHKKGR